MPRPLKLLLFATLLSFLKNLWVVRPLKEWCQSSAELVSLVANGCNNLYLSLSASTCHIHQVLITVFLSSSYSSWTASIRAKSVSNSKQGTWRDEQARCEL